MQWMYEFLYEVLYRVLVKQAFNVASENMLFWI